MALRALVQETHTEALLSAKSSGDGEPDQGIFAFVGCTRALEPLQRKGSREPRQLDTHAHSSHRPGPRSRRWGAR
jgi:hypothetical protein